MYLQNKTNANMRYAKPSSLITSLLPKQSSKPHARSLPGVEKEDNLSNSLRIVDYDSTALFDHDDADKESNRILLSVSRMNTYFKCHYAFYLQYILGLTGIPSYYLSYGMSIHGCIQDLTPVRIARDFQKLYLIVVV